MLLLAFLPSAGDELNSEDEEGDEYGWMFGWMVGSSASFQAVSSPGFVSLSLGDCVYCCSTVSLGTVNCGMLSGHDAAQTFESGIAREHAQPCRIITSQEGQMR